MNIHAPLYSHFINGRCGATADASETVFKRLRFALRVAEMDPIRLVGPKVYRHFNMLR